MSRIADYAIQGFLYQFNKALLEILKAQDNAVITIEGIVEDIDITIPGMTKAIQCKYHEAKEVFAESDIYKPILQMLCHFKENSNKNFRYILFAYFPLQPSLLDMKSLLEKAVKSKNTVLQKYIEKIGENVDFSAFLERFSYEPGVALDELEVLVNEALIASGIPADDIEILAYPNAIQRIASLSIKHNETDRKISKRELLNFLRNVKKIAVSRWTMALKTRKQLLDGKRKQLKANLDKNACLRYLLVRTAFLEDFHDEIILFVKEYLETYHFKPTHTHTPLLSIDISDEDLCGIIERLGDKNIYPVDGYVGSVFKKERFFREPMIARDKRGYIQEREFPLRIISWENFQEISHEQNANIDEIYLLGEGESLGIDVQDIRVECLAAHSLKEIKYMMGICTTYE